MTNDALERNFLAMSGAPLNAIPGALFEYWNTNFDLLGLLVDSIDESYKSCIQRNVCDPLDMDDAFASLADAHAQGVASGYYPYFALVRSQDDAICFE